MVQNSEPKFYVTLLLEPPFVRNSADFFTKGKHGHGRSRLKTYMPWTPIFTENLGDKKWSWQNNGEPCWMLRLWRRQVTAPSGEGRVCFICMAVRPITSSYQASWKTAEPLILDPQSEIQCLSPEILRRRLNLLDPLKCLRLWDVAKLWNCS